MHPSQEMSVCLYPLQSEDIDFLYSLTSDPQVAQYMRFSTHTSREEAEALYHEYCLPDHFSYCIRLTENGSPVGIAALKPEAPEDRQTAGRVYTVSVFTHPSYWNRGYSTQIVRQLQTIAAEQGITVLKAYVVQENTGSRKVLEKTAFRLQEIQHFPDLPSGLYIYTWTPPALQIK